MEGETSMTDTLTVEIPADVKDNSETVTDYAFMRHRAQSDWPYHTAQTRDREIERVTMFPRLGLTHYQWHDVNQGDRRGDGAGQRCRFDMIVNRDGHVVNLYHTEYFTRVACATGDWCYSYADRYALILKDGEPTTDGPLPYCEEHLRTLDSSLTVHLSEPLIVGNHD